MSSKDWLFHLEDMSCNFRAVGVLIKDDKILVQRPKGSFEFALPGGHVKIGESSDKTLVREFKEETGADIIVQRLIWVEEYFCSMSQRDYHGLAFYYLIDLEVDNQIKDDGEFVSQKDNCDVLIGWLPIKELKDITIYPSFLLEKINCITNNIEYFNIKY